MTPSTSASTAVVDTLQFVDPVDGFAFELVAQPAQRVKATGRPVSSRTATTNAPGPRSTATSAANAALWVTKDGGAHWRPSGLRDVVAFAHGSRIAFVLTGRCGYQRCDHLTLHRFDTSTGSWKVVALPFTSAPSRVSMAESGSSLWIMEDSSPASRGRLWASSNRGEHFVKRAAPCPGATVVAAAPTTLWALCGGPEPTVRRSVDGGATWSPVAAPVPLGPEATISPTGTAAALIAPATAATGSMLLRTTDGGKTFHDVSPVARGRWALVRFSASRSGGALLVTPGSAASSRPVVQLWRSTDGGARWTGPVRAGP